MIEEAIKKIIQDTRMNKLAWERGEETEDKKILTTKAEVKDLTGNTQEVPVKFERVPSGEMSRGYYLYVGKEIRKIKPKIYQLVFLLFLFFSDVVSKTYLLFQLIFLSTHLSTTYHFCNYYKSFPTFYH